MYLTIFPLGWSKQRIALYLAFIVTFAFALTAPLLAMFWCGPNVSKHWEVGSGCSFWNRRIFIIDWIMNIISDIMIFLLPFPLLAKLRLSKRQIVALCVTFGLGTITILVSTLRFSTFIQHAFLPLCKAACFYYTSRLLISTDVWSIAEISTGIMVVSLPALRPLLRKAGNAVTSTTVRRHNSWPNQTLPNSAKGSPSFRLSKRDHRSTPKLPEGYHYAYDEERADSDLELHGTMKSDMGPKTETIAIYADTTDVLDRDRYSRDTPYDKMIKDTKPFDSKKKDPV
jgi:rhodopsin domain-containing protein